MHRIPTQADKDAVIRFLEAERALKDSAFERKLSECRCPKPVSGTRYMRRWACRLCLKLIPR